MIHHDHIGLELVHQAAETVRQLNRRGQKAAGDRPCRVVVSERSYKIGAEQRGADVLSQIKTPMLIGQYLREG